MIEKICSTCNTLTTEFYRNRRAKDGYRSQCKACHIKAVRRSTDPAKRKRYNATYRERHLAYVRAYSREYQRTHRLEKAASQRRYYARHRQTIIAKQMIRNAAQRAARALQQAF